MTEQRQTGYSINRYIRFLMGGLLLLGVLNIVLLVVTVHYSRAERVRRLENTISIYLEDVSTRFKAIDHFMVYSTVNDPNLKKLAGLSPTTDIAAMIKPLDGFRQRVSDQQYSTGTAYQFYYFSSKTGYFTNVSPLQVDYEDYGKIQSQLVDGWATKTTIIAEPWKPIVVSGKYYLYHEVRYQDTVLFCVIAVSALTGPIQNDYLTPQDFAYLRLDGQDLIKGKHPALVKSGTRYMKTTDRARTLPFSFNVQLDQYSQTEKFTVLQIILVILTTIIGGGAIFAVIYLWRNFAIPLREFSSAVKMMTADPDGPNLDASRIKELENVNEQFHTLMTQVRSLKLSLYENEIQQKKSQIQFMQLQIRPHFYLNILTTLFSMIQMNEMDHMSDLIMSATKYMRYLLNAGDDLVPLAQEVEHAKEYLNIQRIRYGDDILQADFQIDARAADVLVPPLSIQTFVENTVKYAVSFDSKTLIKVTAAQTMSTEGEFLQLVISDNGPGYPPAILQAVADEHQIDLSEHHIGINNVIARLDLLYNHTYHLKLENLKNGGACTTLELPIQRAVKGENRDESAAGR